MSTRQKPRFWSGLDLKRSAHFCDPAAKYLAASPPHLSAMIRFALSTGCRAREITGLEWGRVNLERRTAWLDQTKNGTPRGVPLNEDAVAVLEGERGKHPRVCFTYRGRPIAWELTNNAWHTAIRKAGIARPGRAAMS